jgi:uncharacterized membrane protein (UPF0127 family)
MILLLLVACARAGLPTTSLTLGAEAITVEVADDEVERSQGLMYRDHLGADAGMLFVYPDLAERGFWMKNTKIPLSIAFADADGVIVGIADMKPLDTNTPPSGAPARFALEMNRGWFAAHGIEEGNRIQGLPTAPAR